MHGAKYRHAAESVRRRDRQLAVHRATTSPRRSASIAQRIHVAYPGVEPGFSADGERFESLRPPVRAHRRDAGAAEEPRAARRGVPAARRGELALASSARPAGASSRSSTRRGSCGSATRSRDELPRLYRGASAFVYPSLFEGFGMPIVEAMACGVAVRRLVASVARRGVRRRGGARRPGRSRGDRSGDRAGARRARRARVARPRARAAVHVARERPRASRRVARPRRERRRRRDGARADARRHRALSSARCCRGSSAT